MTYPLPYMPAQESKTLSLDSLPVECSEERKSILLVEDDEDLSAVLKILLQCQNYDVCVANRGVQGIGDILSRDFDVIICDMVMPTMPGDMFYLAVNKVKPHLCRRFIFITGHQHQPRIAAFLATVDRTILIKPLATRDLFLHVAAIISETGRRRELGVEPEQFEWFPAQAALRARNG